MAELAVEHRAEDNVTWNFWVNIADIMFMTLGLTLISRDTVMPALVRSLTDSKLTIGLIPALVSMGFYLPQLLTANFTERLRYKKPFVMLISSFGERLPYLLIALSIWLFAVPAPNLTLALFFFFLAVATFSAGSATPAWYDMIAKVIPVQRRGLWSGLGHSLGAVLGVIGAYFVGRILVTYAYPNNYALLFALAFVSTAISWVALTLNREPPSENLKEPIPITRYLRRLPDVLRSDHNYLRFLLARTTVQFGAMASGFFMVYGIEHFQIGGAGVGMLTAVLISAQAIMNLVWGVIGDRRGHKMVLAGAAFAMALAALVTWLAGSQTWLVVTFVLLGAYTAADTASGLNIILEFCRPDERPTYIGLTNTLLAPMLIVSPLVGAWLASAAGYRTLFLAALTIASLGGLLLTFWVREPRRASSGA